MAALPETACWRGGWRNAAFALSNCFIGAGTSTVTCPRRFGDSVETSISPPRP